MGKDFATLSLSFPKLKVKCPSLPPPRGTHPQERSAGRCCSQGAPLSAGTSTPRCCSSGWMHTGAPGENGGQLDKDAVPRALTLCGALCTLGSVLACLIQPPPFPGPLAPQSLMQAPTSQPLWILIQAPPPATMLKRNITLMVRSLVGLGPYCCAIMMGTRVT